jgi:hypothetical protein
LLLAKIPAMGATAASAAGTQTNVVPGLLINPAGHPPSRDNYPSVPFWTRQEWESFKNEDRHTGLHTEERRHGKVKDKSQPSRCLAYITDAAGIGVDGYKGASIRATTRQVWAYIAKQGQAPMTWSQAHISAVQYYRQEMYRDHPDLRLCEGDWKVDLLAVQNYPAWCRTRTKLVAGMKAEPLGSSDDELMDSVPENASRIKKRTKHSAAKEPHKKLKIKHDPTVRPTSGLAPRVDINAAGANTESRRLINTESLSGDSIVSLPLPPSIDSHILPQTKVGRCLTFLHCISLFDRLSTHCEHSISSLHAM